MCPVARKLRLYIYCITSFPTGQLGQLGPVSSELPEQEQGVSWLPSTLVDDNHLVNGVVNWFENGLVGIEGSVIPLLPVWCRLLVRSQLSRNQTKKKT